MGYFGLAPYGFENKTGAALDYFNLIADELNWKVTYKLVPLARMMATDEVDIILYLAKNKEREEKFLFAEKPLLMMQGALIATKSLKLSQIKDVNDIKPLTIGAWNSGYRSEIMKTPGLKLVTESGATIEDRVLQMVASGHHDAFYSPEIIALQFAMDKSSFADKLKILPLPEPPVPLFVAFSKRMTAETIKEFNDGFAKIEKKIVYKDFLETYRKNLKKQLH